MKQIIGIDIGGSKICGIVLNGKKVVRDLTIVTPKTLFEFERNLLKLVDFLSAEKKISAVGVGMAGLVNAKKGIVARSPNIKFIKNFQLARFFKINGIKKVKIDNDASCFTRAELFLGQGRGFKDFLALTLGTGVGGGIVINKQLYRGSNNYGAELGHILLGDNFFEKLFQPARDRCDYKKIGKLLGRVLVSLTKIFNPQAVILGGSVSSSAAKFLPAAKAEMNKFLRYDSARPKIAISKLNKAGALGAALMWRSKK